MYNYACQTPNSLTVRQGGNSFFDLHIGSHLINVKRDILRPFALNDHPKSDKIHTSLPMWGGVLIAMGDTAGHSNRS